NMLEEVVEQFTNQPPSYFPCISLNKHIKELQEIVNSNNDIELEPQTILDLITFGFNNQDKNDSFFRRVKQLINKIDPRIVEAVQNALKYTNGNNIILRSVIEIGLKKPDEALAIFTSKVALNLLLQHARAVTTYIPKLQDLYEQIDTNVDY